MCLDFPEPFCSKSPHIAHISLAGGVSPPYWSSYAMNAKASLYQRDNHAVHVQDFSSVHHD